MSDYYRNNRGGYGGNGGRGGKRHGGGGRGGPWNNNHKRARQNFNRGGGPYHRGTNNNDYYRHQPPPQGGYHYGVPVRPGAPPPVPHHGPFGSADIRIEPQHRNDDRHDEPGEVVPEPAPSMKQDESAPTNNGRDAKKPPLSEDEVFQEKLKKQIPASEPNLFSSLPPQAKKAPSESFRRHRRECAEKVEGIIEKEVTSSSAAARKADSSDDCDEDEEENGYLSDYSGIGVSKDGNAAKNHLKKFVRALPDNLLFAIGFDLTGDGSDGGTCYCPCGKKNKPWQEQCRLVVADNKACDKAFDTPRALVAHLDNLQNIEKYQDHKYALKYLELVYARSCIPHYKHLAFYPLNSVQDQAIKAKERQIEKELRDKLEAQLREERAARKEADEKLERLKETDEERANLVKEFIEVKKKLGIIGGAPPVPSEFEMESHRMNFGACVKMAQKMIEYCTAKPSKGPLFKVPLDFHLSEFLDELSEKDHEIFRQRLDGATIKRLLNPSTVEFEVLDEVKSLNKNERGDFRAIDQGGPTRAFFTLVWKQLASLTVKYGGSTFKLFREGKAGCIPEKDEYLQYEFLKGRNPKQNWSDAEKKLASVYEAIGRLMAHAIISGLRIPTFVLSPLYRSVCIRGTSPSDASYKLNELVHHMAEEEFGMEWLKERAPYGKTATAVDKKSMLADEAQQFVEEDRKIAVKGLAKGFTLDGNLGFHIAFRNMPLGAVDRLLFASPKCEPHEIIQLIVINTDYGEPTSRQIEFKAQLDEIIMEESDKDKEFLPNLLEWVTAQNFIPFEGRKNIQIYFKHVDGSTCPPGMLPYVHTCDLSVTFPETVYSESDDPKEELRSKLKMSMANSVGIGRFSMN